MIRVKIHVQNLAYCCYLQIWSIFYFCNIVESTPLISIFITSFLHLYSLKCKKEVLNSWTSIAKAALQEEFSTAKMSRAIKNNSLINDAYYVLG